MSPEHISTWDYFVANSLQLILCVIATCQKSAKENKYKLCKKFLKWFDRFNCVIL